MDQDHHRRPSPARSGPSPTQGDMDRSRRTPPSAPKYPSSGLSEPAGVASGSELAAAGSGDSGLVRPVAPSPPAMESVPNTDPVKEPANALAKEPAKESTKDDILRYLMRQGEATAQELAEAFSVSPQAIRRHLKDLEAETLILHQAVQVGMGRPQYVYQLSREGRSRFPSNYGQFALSLLETLRETLPPDQFGAVLQQQWQKKIEDYRAQLAQLSQGEASLGDRLQLLVELRRAEGFMSEVRELGAASGLESEALLGAAVGKGGRAAAASLAESSLAESSLATQYAVIEFNCAIADVAEAFPRLCGHELDLFTEVLPDCTVERTHWRMGNENYCGYLIQSKSPRSSP